MDTLNSLIKEFCRITLFSIDEIGSSKEEFPTNLKYTLSYIVCNHLSVYKKRFAQNIGIGEKKLAYYSYCGCNLIQNNRFFNEVYTKIAKKFEYKILINGIKKEKKTKKEFYTNEEKQQMLKAIMDSIIFKDNYGKS